ncbi:hypothetical protein [Lapidilactobacillus luobeiensis]|uniref:hypothetical protein n=1 Tax=Lapidilactobacillus luobeiensis TaxID=2950371 RepID=UPI0021C26B54|nr:hypothetical protein [Lapidilactobacillus luobeiensis]
MTLTLMLCSHKATLSQNTGEKQTYLTYLHQFAQGDFFQVQTDHLPAFVWVQLDVSLRPALIYLTKQNWIFSIPFNQEREWPYPVSAFSGRRHYATIRYATTQEIQLSRNLAENSHDLKQATGSYPHATANAETRGELVFQARNAIDGFIANTSHGSFPFQSWGIDQRADAEFKLDFGRPIHLEQIILILRADYPHDSYWSTVHLKLSTQHTFILKLKKTVRPQKFTIATDNVEWLILKNLHKELDNSAFPALTEIQTFGHDQINV